MVEGLDRLKRKLTVSIPGQVRERTRKAMEKGADEIVGMAKNLVPVDTGALRDSIGWTWGDAPEGAMVLASSRRVDGERITIFAGTRNKSLGDSDAFYARWVEFGTQKAYPRPFFFPSYRTLKRRVKGRITREMRKAIREGATK